MPPDAGVRGLVRNRAHERCEYCLLPENAVEIPFHVEHIVAKQHGGGDEPTNLCLAGIDRKTLTRRMKRLGIGRPSS